MALMKSWVASANSEESGFPLNNLPYGVFAHAGGSAHCGVAIGDQILDLTALEAASQLGLFDTRLFDRGGWNAFMAEGPEAWAKLRRWLIGALGENSPIQALLEPYMVAQSAVTMQLPFQISEFTDFYAGRHHAENVGTMFRGPENALPPNWLNMPIGYNGRASSVVVSGTPVRRPWGQVKPADADAPILAPSRRFDFELEIGAIVGQPSSGPVTVAEADRMIFGYVLLNDWSARDIQAWEYQPLGPFQAKATATSISPWIVTRAALEPFRAPTPPREGPLLPYLQEPGPMLYDIDLEVALRPEGKGETTIARTNMRALYYSPAQQLAHHTLSGCPMRVGDLLGTGTISGPERESRGSMLELSWGGKEPLTLPESGEVRSFLEDGDTVTLKGAARGAGYRIGFGECSGTLMPASPAAS